jgi:zinc/manganese transport system permease protein
VLDILFEPLGVGFVTRALISGILLAAVCAMVGVWVITRGMAFLGEAMSHSMLPGVAIAALLDIDLVVGAALSSVVMVLALEGMRTSRDFGRDTSIGLLFVGLLAIGVIIVSHSASFATDLTAFLFGDVLAVDQADLLRLALLVAIVAVVTAGCYRAFLAVTFDERKAHTLGLHPKAANLAMVVLLAITMAGAFSVVGTLLAFGMLVAPSATAMLFVRRVPVAMATAFVLGGVATVVGLLISWHASTAAGATIAVVAVGMFFLALILRSVVHRFRRSSAAAPTPTKEVPDVLAH